MQFRSLSLLLSFSLCVTGWGAEPPHAATLTLDGPSGGTDAAPQMGSPFAIGEPAVVVVDESHSTNCCLARLGDQYFLRTDFLYWQATDPRENGVIIKRAIVSTNSGFTTTSVDSFSTGRPNTDHEMGFRTFVGRHLNENWSVELGGFWLHDFSFPSFFVRQSDAQNSARVFLTPLQDETSNPTLLSDAASRELLAAALIYEIETHGIEWNARAVIHEGPMLRVDGIAGLRYLDYDEKFGSRITFLNGAVADEMFRTENTFFGPTLGAEAWARIAEYVSLRGTAKFSFTANFQDVDVSGPTPGNGVLTGPGNLAGEEGTAYATVVELGIGIVGHLSPNCQVSLGYDALWLSDTVRAMDQLDLANVDSRSPVLLSRRSEEVWLRGFNASLQINY